MAWVAITEADLRDRMAQDEIDVIEETGGGTGDRLTGIIAQVTALVRGKVAACDKNTLESAGLIPLECKHAAVTLVRHSLRASLPAYSDAELETRRAEYEDAIAFLNQVASCEVLIENSSGNVGGRDSGCYGGDLKHDF